MGYGPNSHIRFNVCIFFPPIFSPAILVPQPFRRLIRHKIEVGDPTPPEFTEIFKRACESKRVPYDEKGMSYLIQEWYIKRDRKLRAVHPRDILDQLLDIARYLNRPPALTKDLIDRACEAYFVQL